MIETLHLQDSARGIQMLDLLNLDNRSELFTMPRWRHNVLYLSIRSSVRPSVRYKTCQHDILKTTVQNFMKIR